MSIFRSTKLDCPSCRAKVEFKAVHSVNADRRPDLRAGIIAETFQQERCPHCGAQFRLDPEFNLMDTQRGQWVAAEPLRNLANWEAEEKHARDLFDRAYGPLANPLAQDIGKSLTPRITFGWPALREKLLVSEHLLDDVVLEVCKMFVIRNSDSPVSAETELRLLDVVEGDLVLGWLVTADETPGPAMRLARTVYDQIEADEEGDWEDLKATFEDSLFVDLNRLLMTSSSVPVSPAPGAPAAAAVEPPADAGGDDEEKEEVFERGVDSVEEGEATEAEEAGDEAGDGPEK